MTLCKPGSLNAKLNVFFFFLVGWLVGWLVQLRFFCLVGFVNFCFTLFLSSGSSLVRALTKHS